MVMSTSLPRKSVCTSPTRLKNLSGDAEVADTVRYCPSPIFIFPGHLPIARVSPKFLGATKKIKKKKKESNLKSQMFNARFIV
jgi:hypothetical protein